MNKKIVSIYSWSLIVKQIMMHRLFEQFIVQDHNPLRRKNVEEMVLSCGVQSEEDRGYICRII